MVTQAFTSYHDHEKQTYTQVGIEQDKNNHILPSMSHHTMQWESV